MENKSIIVFSDISIWEQQQTTSEKILSQNLIGYMVFLLSNLLH